MRIPLIQAIVTSLVLTAGATLGQLVQDPASGLRTGTITVNGSTYTIGPEADLAGANLAGANLIDVDLSDADLSGANLRGADLSGADLRGITANNLSGCPKSLPNGWVCKNNSLIQR